MIFYGNIIYGSYYEYKFAKGDRSRYQKVTINCEEKDLEDFLIELSKFYSKHVFETFTKIGLLKSTFSTLPLSINEHKNFLLLLQGYSPSDWYKLYSHVSKLPELPSSWYFKNYGNLRLNGMEPINWIKEFFKDPMNKLVSEHPEVRNEEKEEERTSLLTLIKDLLLELSENDEISMDLALKTIKEEKTIELISDEEILESVRKIVSDLPDFEYIRLKRVFRRKQDKSENLSSEIDKIINEMLKQYSKI